MVGIETRWQPVLAGVPQGSLLKPFLIYVDDLPDGFKF